MNFDKHLILKLSCLGRNVADTFDVTYNLVTIDRQKSFKFYAYKLFLDTGGFYNIAPPQHEDIATIIV